MKNFRKYSLLILFTVIMLLLFVVDILKPIKNFSELENRFLENRPKFSIDLLVQNKYTLKYETFINDQFIGRNIWIDIKSRAEALLGKIENNGIVYGKENYLFEKYSKVDDERLNNNLNYINEFFTNYSKYNLSFGIIPNSYQVLNDKIPVGLSNVNQTEYISEAYSKINNTSVKQINFTNVLNEKKSEYIYYKTDHHWTTLGAYYAYLEYVKHLYLTPLDISSISSTQIKDFYGSYYSKAKNYNAVSDTITYYNVPASSVEVDGKAVEGIYDLDTFNKRDKYAGFLRGNNGLTIIKSDVNNNINGKTSRVLVIKDSYSNSFVPFLLFNFDEVYVIDLRSYTNSISQVINNTDFNDILVIYNFMNLVNDANIYKLNQ